MRPGLVARPVVPEDLADLAQLCLTARAETGLGSQVCSDDAARVARQLGTLADTPGGHVLMVGHDDVPVGLLLGRVVGPSAFTDEANFYIEALYVHPEHRRRGVGHALLAEAVRIAEERGAEHIYAVPLPGARGQQRFLARLGFARAVSYRVVPTGVLQRRLAGEPVVRGGRVRSLDELIARRRQARAGGAAPVASDAAAPASDGPVGRAWGRLPAG